MQKAAKAEKRAPVQVLTSLTGRQFASKPRHNTKRFPKTPTPGTMKQEETRNPMKLARHVTFRIARVSRRRDSRLPCFWTTDLRTSQRGLCVLRLTTLDQGFLWVSPCCSLVSDWSSICSFVSFAIGSPLVVFCFLLLPFGSILVASSFAGSLLGSVLCSFFGSAGPCGCPLVFPCFHVGSLLVPCWFSFGSLLVPFWFLFGSLLVLFWFPFRSFLVPFWFAFGSLLVPFWFPFGSLLVPFWFPFGSLLVPFWFPFGSLFPFFFLVPFWVPFWLPFARFSVSAGYC